MAGRCAVITGASSGIGAVFARRLAHDGFHLVLIARRRHRLEALAAETGDAEVLVADLATDEGIRIVEARLAVLPDLELLINNAGFGIAGAFFDTGIKDHERMHRLHVIATLRLTHAALRRMVPADRGAIVNVSSVAGFTVSPGSVSYAATKHWMNNFTEGLWLDLKTRNSRVQVQALCPGYTLSEFHDVMPMDRSAIPSGWWTDARDVVEASLDGLRQNRLFVIPGLRYRAIVALSRVVPVTITRSIGIWFSRNFRKPR